MCGIAGFIGKSPIPEPKVSRTLDLMKNRGPDHQAYLALKDRGNFIVFLHSRLKIIDFDERANQPFTIGEQTIIFNGEIYNYLELKKDLEKRGIVFRTESDTEVLLQCYRVFGESCADYFEGMWSFAIYDRKTGKLFLSRDRFAEKPLYFLRIPEGMYFGSEVKFIKSLAAAELSVNMRQVFRYLVNGYKALYKGSDTFFNEVGEIPYATNMVVERDLVPKTVRYWQPSSEPRNMTLGEAVDGFKHHLLESVKIRLRSDVPIAFCLSGGVDSGAITSIARKVFNYDVKTFSIIDSHEYYNEYDNIKATINDLGCKHKIIDIPRDGIFTRLEKLVKYHDAPVATITYYIHSFLSEEIAKDGYRVVVSGTAADELATGYYDHFNMHLYEMRHEADYENYRSAWENKISNFVRNPYLKNPKLYFDNPAARDHIYMDKDIFTEFLTVDFKEDFTESVYADSLLRNRMLNELFHETIPVILHEDDLNSMFYSIENRSPYLDSRLYKFAYSIPNKFLIQDGYGKYILREAVSGILNDTVRQDRQKKGFNASVNSLIDLREKKNREYILEDGRIFEFVKRDRIAKLLREYPTPDEFNKFLFYFLSAKIFLELNGKSA